MQRFRMSSRRRVMPCHAAVRSLALGVALAATQLTALGCAERADDQGETPSLRAVGPRYGHGQSGGTNELAAAALFDNHVHSCLGDDALASGLTSGIKSAEDMNCTSNDITLDQFSILAYSSDGITFTAFNPSSPITCISGQTLFVQSAAVLSQTASAARTDIGLWLATDGGDGITGICQQYTLNTGFTGVVDVDSDQCGDLAPGGVAIMSLGVVPLTCTDNGSGFIHVGTCIAWKGSNDTVCPTASSDLGYRYGSVPSSKSKCNCSGFDVPVTVL